MATQVVTRSIGVTDLPPRFVTFAHTLAGAGNAFCEADSWKKSGAEPRLVLVGLSDTAATFEWINNYVCGEAELSCTVHRGGSGGSDLYTTAVGDPLGNDTDALRNDLDMASLFDRSLVLESDKVYPVDGEIELVDEVEIIGNRSTIRAIAAMDRMIVCDGYRMRAQQVFFDAARLANVAVYLKTASRSRFRECDFYEALVDGLQIHSATDSVYIESCNFQLNGRVFHTSGYAGGAPAILKTLVSGTVEVTVNGGGANIITGTGTSFLSYGLRMGDFVSVHATAPGDRSASWMQVSTIDSDTQITCIRHPAVAAIAAGAKFSLHVGNGYHEGPGRADNNNHIHVGCLYRNNAGCGVFIHGLYGPHIILPQADANFGAYPIAVSYYNLITYGVVIESGYYELNTFNNVYLGCAGDVLLLGARVGELDRDGPILSHADFNWGLMMGQLHQIDPGRIDPIGNAPVIYVPAARLAAADQGGGRYGCYAKGKIFGQNYTRGAAGLGSIDINDFQNPAFAMVSGIEPPQGGAGTTSVAYDLDTEAAVTNGALGVDLLTKHHTRWRNDQVVKAALGFEGDFRYTYEDQQNANANAGGDCTVDKVSGRFAIANGGTTATVTNALCRTTSVVVIQQETNDPATFKVVPGNGSFVVTASAATGAKVVFSFVLFNKV